MDTLRFSAIVGAIYDSAIDPARWPATLGLVCGALGFANAVIALHRLPGGAQLITAASGLSPADVAAVQAFDADLIELGGGSAAIMARPIDVPWVTTRLVSAETIARNRYVREWAAPRGMIDSVSVILAREPGLAGSLAMGRHHSRGPVDARTVAATQLLLPHLQRAGQISGILDASAIAARDFAAVIDAIAVPVLLVRADLALIHANPAADALLAGRGVVCRRGAQLGSAVPGVERALGTILARIAADDAAIPGSGLGLPIRAGDDAAHTLHVLPLGHGTLRPRLASGAIAAIFVSSSIRAPGLARDVLQPLFGLTDAEMAVFTTLYAGHSTAATAHELGIARSTVRTHLQRLFDKTGVKRQADLIRLGAALASPVARAGRD